MGELNRLLRKDAFYRACDDECGGIFLSSNNAPALIPQLVRDNIAAFPAAGASDPVGKRG